MHNIKIISSHFENLMEMLETKESMFNPFLLGAAYNTQPATHNIWADIVESEIKCLLFSTLALSLKFQLWKVSFFEIIIILWPRCLRQKSRALKGNHFNPDSLFATYNEDSLAFMIIWESKYLISQIFQCCGWMVGWKKGCWRY